MRIKKTLSKIAVVGILSGVMTFAPNVVDLPIIPTVSVANAQEDEVYDQKMDEWRSLFTQKKYNEALNISNELIQNYPEKWNSYHARGATYQYMHQYDKALVDIDKAIELINMNIDKDFESLPFKYGQKVQIYEEMHQPDKVRECKEKEVETYTICIQKKPDNPNFYSLRAHVYDDLGEYQKAISDFKKAASMPHHIDEELKKSMEKYGKKYNEDTAVADEYFMCGNIYNKIKDYANAVEMYTKGLELNPDESLYWNERGQCYEVLGEKDKAKADYVEYEIRSKGGNTQETQEENSSDFKVSNEARKFSSVGNYKKAIEIYTEGLKTYPNSDLLYILRSSCYSMLKEYDNALADIDKAIEIDPYNFRYYESKASIYKDMKQYDKVVEIYTQLIEKDSYEIEYYRQRGEAYEKLNDEQHATEDYKKYLSMWSKTEETMDMVDYLLRGDVYKKIKDYQHAIEDYTKAIAFNQSNSLGLLYYSRAECYEALGEKDKAKADRVEAKMYGW